MLPAILFPAVFGALVAMGQLAGGAAPEGRPPEHPNVRAVRLFYAALTRGDLAALSALLSDDFQCVAAPQPGRVLDKGQALSDLARVAARTGGTFQVEVRALFANDERGLAVVTERAERASEGLRLEESGVHVFRFREGRIVGLTGLPERPEAVARFWR